MHYRAAVECLKRAKKRRPRDGEVAYWLWRAEKETGGANARSLAKSALALSNNVQKKAELAEFLKTSVRIQGPSFQTQLARIYAANKPGLFDGRTLGRFFSVRHKGNQDPNHPGLTEELFIDLSADNLTILFLDDQWPRFKSTALEAVKAARTHQGGQDLFATCAVEFWVGEEELVLISLRAPGSMDSSRSAHFKGSDLDQFEREIKRLP